MPRHRPRVHPVHRLQPHQRILDRHHVPAAVRHRPVRPRGEPDEAAVQQRVVHRAREHEMVLDAAVPRIVDVRPAQRPVRGIAAERHPVAPVEGAHPLDGDVGPVGHHGVVVQRRAPRRRRRQAADGLAPVEAQVRAAAQANRNRRRGPPLRGRGVDPRVVRQTGVRERRRLHPAHRLRLALLRQTRRARGGLSLDHGPHLPFGLASRSDDQHGEQESGHHYSKWVRVGSRMPARLCGRATVLHGSRHLLGPGTPVGGMATRSPSRGLAAEPASGRRFLATLWRSRSRGRRGGFRARRALQRTGAVSCGSSLESRPTRSCCRPRRARSP